jgi:hypothetical protein
MKRIIQQVNEKNTAIVRLQSLISRYDNKEETQRPINRIGELVEALSNQIQRGQMCSQILNSEKSLNI